MAKVKIVFLCAVAFSVAEAQGALGEDDVSPELAREAAAYLIRKYHPKEYELGYDVRISEPRIYYDYSGKRKYYAVYAYFGPGDMPSWETIEKEQEGFFKKANTFRSFIIPADKKEFFYTIGRGSIPITLISHKRAEERLRKTEPSSPWKYRRTIIAVDHIYFVFQKGPEEVIVNPGGRIIELEDLPYNDPYPHHYRIWNEIEEYLQSGNPQGKAYPVDSDGYQPSGWEGEMPHYWQKGGTPPNGDWGCPSTSTADFLAFYYGGAGRD
jgi:hypothetical protein